jgi:hypothetical protein
VCVCVCVCLCADSGVCAYAWIVGYVYNVCTSPGVFSAADSLYLCVCVCVCVCVCYYSLGC